jgi:Na+/H+ antiporter NhaC
VNSFGIVTVVPFVIGIGIILWQEEVLIPLLGALVLGGIMLSKFNPLLGLYNTAGDLILGSLLNVRNIVLIIVIGEVLVLYAVLNRYGFINVFSKKIGRKIRTASSLEIAVFSSSLLVFIDRHLSTLLVGVFSKPLVEKKSLSPIKHAYLLSAVSSSVATLIPFTLLTPVILTAIGTGFKGLGIEFSPLRALYLSLPYQFYNLFALFTVITLLVIKKDTLFMKQLTGRIQETKQTPSFGVSLNTRAHPDDRIAFYGVLATLTVLFGVVIAGVLLNSEDIIMPSLQPLQNYGALFVNALFVAVVFLFLYLFLSRSVRYYEWRDGSMSSGKMYGNLAATLVYIVLAFAMQLLARRLSLGSSILAGLIDKALPMNLIPLIVFILASLVSFLSGSAPLTIGVMIPLSLRIISTNMTDPLIVNNLLFATIGAVLSGATFGDMNSPLSLNYIIATASTDAGIRSRFIAQIGYALVALGATIVFGYLLLTLNVKPYVSISSGFLVIALLLMFLTGTIKNK